jgi:hypothetical protein
MGFGFGIVPVGHVLPVEKKFFWQVRDRELGSVRQQSCVRLQVGPLGHMMVDVLSVMMGIVGGGHV